jgi:hypothetical protein
MKKMTNNDRIDTVYDRLTVLGISDVAYPCVGLAAYESTIGWVRITDYTRDNEIEAQISKALKVLSKFKRDYQSDELIDKVLVALREA